jgi:hypothetical protein
VWYVTIWQARSGTARRGAIRQARRGKAGRGAARYGRCVQMWCDVARPGEAWSDVAGEVWHGKAW